MKTDPQHLLDAHIPWYKTRKFWGVVIGGMILFSIIFYSIGIYSPLRTSYWFFFDISFAFGGALPLFLGWSKISSIFIATTYHLSTIYLGYYTLHKKRVSLIPALALLLMYLIGIIFGIFYVG